MRRCAGGRAAPGVAAALLLALAVLIGGVAVAVSVVADSSAARATTSVERHRSRVTLELAGHLKASGDVEIPDGNRVCDKRRLVVVEMRVAGTWLTIASDHTGLTGRFRTPLPDLSGEYRAKVSVKTVRRDRCLADTSGLRTHDDPPAPPTDGKPLAAGLLTASAMPPQDWRSIIGGWVPVVEWRDLQPTADGPIDTSVIDGLIARADDAGLILRLRIFAGRAAPDWVKQRFGTVTVVDPYDGITATVPRWWEPGYMESYSSFQAKLAALYDGNPTIRSVTVSGAMTIYAEPFLRGIASSTTRANLLAAGYTPEADQQAILASIDAQTAWQQTRQIMTFNPWQYVNADGTYGWSVDFTLQAMDHFRAVFGSRAILQNNSIRSSWTTGTMPGGYEPMYEHMVSLGDPISFQTAQSSRVGDLAAVLDWCIQQGAHAVELQGGFDTMITKEQAALFDLRLEANAA